MVVDTIQQQGARRETLLPVNNVEVLERHLPFFVQHKSPEVTQEHALERLEDEARWPGITCRPRYGPDFLRRLGRNEEAAVAYEESAGLAGTGPERRFLHVRLAEVRP